MFQEFYQSYDVNSSFLIRIIYIGRDLFSTYFQGRTLCLLQRRRGHMPPVHPVPMSMLIPLDNCFAALSKNKGT